MAEVAEVAAEAEAEAEEAAAAAGAAAGAALVNIFFMSEMAGDMAGDVAGELGAPGACAALDEHCDPATAAIAATQAAREVQAVRALIEAGVAPNPTGSGF